MDRHRETEFAIPASLDWLRQSPVGETWLLSLPALVGECAQHWGLTLGNPFPDGHVSLTYPAVNAHRQEVVLKIRFPDDESEHEARALALWNGNGAVALIAEDQKRRAILLERCLPGAYLSTLDAEQALTVFCELLPRLWIPAGQPIGSLADEVARWVSNLPRAYDAAGRPFSATLLNEAINTLTDLSRSQGEQVLIHQDLHANNVISAQREPWLAIDPKPLIGEREFGVSPVIRSAELGHNKAAVIRRLDHLTSELGLDRERARLWAFGQAIAWGFENDRLLSSHLDIAQWLLSAS